MYYDYMIPEEIKVGSDYYKEENGGGRVLFVP